MIKKLGGCRYVQSQISNPALTAMIASSRGQVGKAYDGVTEVWFPSRNPLVAAISMPEGAEASLRLAQDESNFIDLPNSSYFMTHEVVFLRRL